MASSSSPPPAEKDTRPTVLITGCTPGGIGHSLALTFHAHGLRVLATCRPSSLPTLSALSDLGIETLPLDVTSAPSIEACADTVTALTQGRGLAYLVNNAGASYTVPALDVSLADARRLFETNFFGVVAVTQAFAALLIQARGTVVMVGSLAAIMPYVFGSLYNASKAALHAYANTLRVEMAPLGVTVITVVTGGVKSRISRTERVLPEGSRYAELDAQYRARQGHSQEGAMANEAYAASVVGQVVVGRGPWLWRWMVKDARRKWIWEGNKSWVVYWMTGGWMWSGIFDWWFTRLFDLRKLERKDR